MSSCEDFHGIECHRVTRLPFTFVHEIGHGGTSVVYACIDERDGKVVAVKKLHGNAEKSSSIRSRCAKEITAMRAVSEVHGSVMSVFDVFLCENTLYIAMEYAERGELFGLVAKYSPLVEDIAFFFVEPIADAVHAAHQAGIAHRDIKPENILITRDFRPILCDWGFAALTGKKDHRELVHQMNSDSKKSSIPSFQKRPCGTLDYIAPEVHLGFERDLEAADAWSIGVTLYVMLARCSPWGSGSVRSKRRRIIAGEYTPIPDDLSPTAKHIVKSLLMVNPKKRMTVDALLTILRRRKPAEDARAMLAKALGKDVAENNARVFGDMSPAITVRSSKVSGSTKIDNRSNHDGSNNSSNNGSKKENASEALGSSHHHSHRRSHRHHRNTDVDSAAERKKTVKRKDEEREEQEQEQGTKGEDTEEKGEGKGKEPTVSGSASPLVVSPLLISPGEPDSCDNSRDISCGHPCDNNIDDTTVNTEVEVEADDITLTEPTIGISEFDVNSEAGDESTLFSGSWANKFPQPVTPTSSTVTLPTVAASAAILAEESPSDVTMVAITPEPRRRSRKKLHEAHRCLNSRDIAFTKEKNGYPAYGPAAMRCREFNNTNSNDNADNNEDEDEDGRNSVGEMMKMMMMDGKNGASLATMEGIPARSQMTEGDDEASGNRSYLAFAFVEGSPCSPPVTKRPVVKP